MGNLLMSLDNLVSSKTRIMGNIGELQMIMGNYSVTAVLKGLWVISIKAEALQTFSL